MSRPHALLGGLAAVLIVVLFWLLLWNPKSEELAELDIQIADAQAQQVQLQARIGSLRQVRERAPEAEAHLAASEVVVPRDPAMPAALRQLQQAASEAQLTLRSVSPGRAQPLAADDVAMEPGTQLVGYPITVLLEGRYFQVVDFLRRIEDPAISPRGFSWSSMNASVPEEYPGLTVDVSGMIYAVVPAGGIPEEAPPPPMTDENGDVVEDDADGTETDEEVAA
jgi:Tfp pilus assembly protein PilO